MVEVASDKFAFLVEDAFRSIKGGEVVRLENLFFVPIDVLTCAKFEILWSASAEEFLLGIGGTKRCFETGDSFFRILTEILHHPHLDAFIPDVRRAAAERAYRSDLIYVQDDPRHIQHSSLRKTHLVFANERQVLPQDLSGSEYFAFLLPLILIKNELP